MRILVDADACPVVRIVERVARKHKVPLLAFCDTSHVINMEYGGVVTVSEGVDAVDFALLGRARKGDVVVTQDFGVAALALGKGAYAIHQNGRWYTDDNMDILLFERYLAGKARSNKKRKRSGKGRKRTKADDVWFEESFDRLLRYVIARNGDS